jgi:hypothetical protein
MQVTKHKTECEGGTIEGISVNVSETVHHGNVLRGRMMSFRHVARKSWGER